MKRHRYPIGKHRRLTAIRAYLVNVAVIALVAVLKTAPAR